MSYSPSSEQKKESTSTSVLGSKTKLEGGKGSTVTSVLSSKVMSPTTRPYRKTDKDDVVVNRYEKLMNMFFQLSSGQRQHWTVFECPADRWKVDDGCVSYSLSYSRGRWWWAAHDKSFVEVV